MLTANTVKVMVGSGAKAHLFEPRAGANAKVFALKDGGTAFDHVLCGQSGALTLADPDADLCKTCQGVLDRRPS